MASASPNGESTSMRTSSGRRTTIASRVQRPESPLRRRARARSVVTAARRAASPSSSSPAATGRSTCGARNEHPASSSTATRPRAIAREPADGVWRYRRSGARVSARAPHGPPDTLETGALGPGRAFERTDLVLQPLHLRALLRAGERITVDPEGVARVPLAPVGVAEVLGNRRIVARELDRALQLLDRARIVAALVVHPAEAVDVEPVVGLECNRGADQPLGLVELHAHFGVGVAEVIERGGVLRVELDGTLHLLDGARLVLGLVVSGAEREAIAVVVGIALDHLLEDRDRRLQILLLAVERREVPHELGIVGLRLQGARDLLHGGRQLVVALEDVRALDARVDVVLGVGRNLPELVERTLGLLALGVDGAEVVAHPPVLGLGGEDQVELGRGTL